MDFRKFEKVCFRTRKLKNTHLHPPKPSSIKGQALQRRNFVLPTALCPLLPALRTQPFATGCAALEIIRGGTSNICILCASYTSFKHFLISANMGFGKSPITFQQDPDS